MWSVTKRLPSEHNTTTWHDTHHGDLFPPQSRAQPAIDFLEAVLSIEGKIYCEEKSDGQPKQPHLKQPACKQAQTGTLTIPLVFEEPGGVFLLGSLLLQQRQQPLLLLSGAIHEIIPWLKGQENEEDQAFFKPIVSLGAFRSDQSWITDEL